MKPLPTPKWIDSLIDSLAPSHLAEEIRGDLYELLVRDMRKSNLSTARVKYIFNALGFLVRSFFWKGSCTNSFTMTGSYFKMAWRSLMAYKGTALINIVGLITGIAATLVIITVLQFELSFDAFHSDSNRIYRMVRVSGQDMNQFRSGISFPVAAAMNDEIQAIEKITAVEYYGGANVNVLGPGETSVRKFREESGFAFVDTSFFNVFDFKDTGFKWLAGHPEHAFREPYTMVLTHSMAKKYFGDENPMGQTIRLQQKYDLKITGIITDFPANTDFPFTVLISYPTVRVVEGTDNYDSWFNVNDSHNVFVVPTPGTTRQEMETLIAKVHAAHTPKDLHESRHYLLQELGDLHFDPKFGNYNRRTVTKDTLTGLAFIAAFLLLTASINYINLATAQSTLRGREIGIRKVMGSNRKNLVLQFLAETFVVVAIAAILACGVAELLVLSFYSLLNLQPDSLQLTDPLILFSLLSIVMTVTFFSGIYPSLIISQFNPVSALKSKFSTGLAGGISLRKVLVVIQFTITQILVVGTYIVVTQMEFFSTVDMGFSKEGIVSARVPNRNPAVLKVMSDKLHAASFVSDVSFSYTLPSGVRRNRWYAGIGRPDATNIHQVFEYVAIDSSYLGFYDIKLLAGRNLNINDTSGNILINHSLVKNLQLGSVQDAVGQELRMGDGTKVTVAGVVDDYYSNSMKEQADNMVLLMEPEDYSAVSVKLNIAEGQSLQHAIEGIGSIWSETFPEFVFNYDFLDQNIAAFYNQERKYADLFQMFSIIFLLIGCLGLYGLITFVVNRKSKEVAIRKVLGATLTNILILFSKEYVQLILLSFAIAAPVAWYLTNEWLSTFANHIPLQWWLFLIPGLTVLCIAALVVCAKTFGAANTNPVEKLKCE